MSNRVRLADVIRNVNTFVEPEAIPEARYLAGEHLDEDDLRVTRWGMTTDDNFPPTFKRWFLPGQTLLHSRNPRKVVVPPFAGVTGEKLFILEPIDPDVVWAPLVPYLLQSKRFRRFLGGALRGSVNKYLNWKQLADFHFELPSLEEQHRVVRYLAAADTAWETQQAVVTASLQAIDAAVERTLTSADWPIARCEEVLVTPPRNGVSVPANGQRTGYPTLSIGAIQRGDVVTDGFLKWATLSAEQLASYRLRRDDVLVVRGNGNKDLTGRCGLVRDVPNDCFYPDLLIRLEFDRDRVLPAFGALQWNSRHVQRPLTRRAKSTNGIWKVNGKDIRQQRLVVPPIAVQQELLDDVNAVHALASAAAERQSDTRQLRAQLVDELLGWGAADVH